MKKKNQIMALEEFTILELLNKLDKQARVYGGRVHYLIGNHELMNVIGDFSYVLPNHLTKIPVNIREELFKPGGYMAQMLACHSYSILKINNWIFCHGGLLPSHIKKICKCGYKFYNEKKKTCGRCGTVKDNMGNNGIKYINQLLRKILLNKLKISDLTDDEHKIILGTDGLFWTRHYKFDPKKCNTLKNTLEIINNDKEKGGLIVGHTPHSNVTAECNNKLFFVDIGLSRAFPDDEFNQLEALLIEKDKQPVILK